MWELIIQSRINLYSWSDSICVDTRELYEYLWLFIRNYARWIETNIIENEFAIEWEDYRIEWENIFVTIDFAKMLWMMSRSEKWDKIRRYFIQVEKEHIQSLQNKLLEWHTNTLIAEYGWYKQRIDWYLPPILWYGREYIFLPMNSTEAEKWKTLYLHAVRWMRMMLWLIKTKNKKLRLKDEAFVEEDIVLPSDDVNYLEYLLRDKN